MKPSQLARSLKRIASGIENSNNPKKELVIRDLKRILATMHTAVVDYTPESIGEEIIQGLERIKSAQGPRSTGTWVVDSSFEGDSNEEIIIDFDSARKEIYAKFIETDEEGNVWDVTIPYTLTPGNIIRELSHKA